MKNNENDVFFVQEEKEDLNKIKTYKQVIPITIHHFYISSDIGEVNQYLDLIHTLKTAEQHDTIMIYLNTPGGSLTTTINILSAMKQSQATIITCMEGQVASAGSMIFLQGHKYLVNPNCSFMIHNYRGGILGKGQEIAAEAKFQETYIKSLYNDIYHGFLTEYEIDNVIEGKDIWLTSDEVIERLQNKLKTVEGSSATTETKIPTLIDKLVSSKDLTEDYNLVKPPVEESEPINLKKKSPTKKKINK